MQNCMDVGLAWIRGTVDFAFSGRAVHFLEAVHFGLGGFEESQEFEGSQKHQESQEFEGSPGSGADPNSMGAVRIGMTRRPDPDTLPVLAGIGRTAQAW